MSSSNETSVETTKGRRRTTIALVAGIVAVLAIPLSALGRLAGLWGPMPIMIVAFLATFIGLLMAIIMGLIGVRKAEGPYQKSRSMAALVLGLAVAVPVGAFLVQGLPHPPIHDISTDTENPPKYVALQIERDETKAPNTTEWNPKAGEQQKKGFPELAPVKMAMAADAAYAKALDAAKAMEWRIAAAVPEEGRIEAVDVTFWSGFIDDVVIRITPVDENNSILDVRSLSRVGGGDAGKNASRIKAYLVKLNGG